MLLLSGPIISRLIHYGMRSYRVPRVCLHCKSSWEGIKYLESVHTAVLLNETQIGPSDSVTYDHTNLS